MCYNVVSALGFHQKIPSWVWWDSIFEDQTHKRSALRLCYLKFPTRKSTPKIGAQSTGPIPPSQLIQVVEIAAKIGADV